MILNVRFESLFQIGFELSGWARIEFYATAFTEADLPSFYQLANFASERGAVLLIETEQSA